jgi:hypothetical protein
MMPDTIMVAFTSSRAVCRAREDAAAVAVFRKAHGIEVRHARQTDCPSVRRRANGRPDQPSNAQRKNTAKPLAARPAKIGGQGRSSRAGMDAEVGHLISLLAVHNIDGARRRVRRNYEGRLLQLGRGGSTSIMRSKSQPS